MAEESQFVPYSATARCFHWVFAGLVLVMRASGLVMVCRGKDLSIWGQLINNLYKTHKMLGLVVLALIFLRRMWPRLRRRAHQLISH